jgi:hypothetical protein
MRRMVIIGALFIGGCVGAPVTKITESSSGSYVAHVQAVGTATRSALTDEGADVAARYCAARGGEVSISDVQHSGMSGASDLRAEVTFSCAGNARTAAL